LFVKNGSFTIVQDIVSIRAPAWNAWDAWGATKWSHMVLPVQ